VKRLGMRGLAVAALAVSAVSSGPGCASDGSSRRDRDESKASEEIREAREEADEELREADEEVSEGIEKAREKIREAFE